MAVQIDVESGSPPRAYENERVLHNNVQALFLGANFRYLPPSLGSTQDIITGCGQSHSLATVNQ